jgi:NADH:ubiquinone oxidoreductase subunit K
VITLQHYLVVSAALFCLGLLAVLTRRNAVNVLMGIELILNSANVNLVAFSRYGSGPVPLQGQLFAVFVIVIAAAEVAVALAIVLTLYRLRRTPNLDEADILQG